MFVGSIVTGNIYHFDLNEDRTQLVLTGELEDKIAETRKTGTEDIVFGEGFAGISDLEVGSDDYLYVVSLGQGKILRAMIHWTKRLLHVMTSLIVSDCRCCSGINFECFIRDRTLENTLKDIVSSESILHHRYYSLKNFVSS